MRYFLTLLFLIPFTSFSQIKITGRVISDVDKKPVANANVFLSNATIGNRTNEDGTFTLTNVKPGQYDLIVSIVGYNTYKQTIRANTDDIKLDDIIINIKVIELQEVKIKPNLHRDRDYEIFKQLLLGPSDNAADCVITNPGIVDVDYDTSARTLIASTDDFLVIENKALGYRIKYLLTKFIMDYKTTELFYEGSVLFEELNGTPSQQKKWLKTRRQCYDGSNMHFLRSVLSAQLDDNHFIVYKLNRRPNPAWKSGPNGKWLQSVEKVPLQATDIANLTDEKGIFALHYPTSLYVMYTERRNEDNILSHSVSLPNYLSSIINFDAPYVFFDNNGVIANPGSCIFEGAWGKSRVAELLPVDYEPENKSKK